MKYGITPNVDPNIYPKKVHKEDMVKKYKHEITDWFMYDVLRGHYYQLAESERDLLADFAANKFLSEVYDEKNQLQLHDLNPPYVAGEYREPSEYMGLKLTAWLNNLRTYLEDHQVEHPFRPIPSTLEEWKKYLPL